MFFPHSPEPERWDEADARYVRNAVLIGCAVALFTEITRGVVDVVKKHVEKKLEEKKMEKT